MLPRGMPTRCAFLFFRARFEHAAPHQQPTNSARASAAAASMAASHAARRQRSQERARARAVARSASQPVGSQTSNSQPARPQPTPRQPACAQLPVSYREPPGFKREYRNKHTKRITEGNVNYILRTPHRPSQIDRTKTERIQGTCRAAYQNHFQNHFSRIIFRIIFRIKPSDPSPPDVGGRGGGRGRPNHFHNCFPIMTRIMNAL